MKMNTPQLPSTRVLVTGGTSGLGRAMAAALVGAGARVILTGRDRERAEAAAAEIGARVMAADLDGTTVRVNILLPGGATATGMIPDGVTSEVRGRLLDPAIMGPPIVWLCSEEAAGVHDQRIVATEFRR